MTFPFPLPKPGSIDVPLHVTFSAFALCQVSVWALCPLSDSEAA